MLSTRLQICEPESSNTKLDEFEFEFDLWFFYYIADFQWSRFSLQQAAILLLLLLLFSSNRVNEKFCMSGLCTTGTTFSNSRVVHMGRYGPQDALITIFCVIDELNSSI